MAFRDFVCLSIAAVILSAGVAAGKKNGNNTCPDYRANSGCDTGSCKGGGLNGKFMVPSDCPLLVGYSTGAFFLTGNLSDDTAVEANIRVSQRKTAAKCCQKCKEKAKCTVWQWLDLGAYGGLCFLYQGGIGPNCTTDVLVKTRVGGKCKATINDDPHLVGAHGTHYDFSGAPGKSFCLVSDRRVHLNMKLTGYLDNRTESASLLSAGGQAVRTWIKEVGLLWRGPAGGHSLRLVARGGPATARGEEGFLALAAADGDALPAMRRAGDEVRYEGGLAIRLEALEKKGPYDVDYYTVKLDGLLDMDVRLRVANPLLQRPDDAEVHFSLGINWINSTPSIHGVLGQTYREGREQRAMEFSRVAALLHHSIAADGESGKGFLDGAPSDYVSSGVLDADCAFSAYQGYAQTELALPSDTV